MRTTLDLPDPLFRTLKARAAMDGTSLKDLLISLVQRGLADSQASPQVPHQRSLVPVLVHGPLLLTAEQSTSNAALYDLMYADEDAKAIAFMNGTPLPESTED
jgi:hypothetical protein